MKIINRLYFKVIVIAVILIVGFIGFYYMDISYQNISQQQSKKLQQVEKNSLKIGSLEKKIVAYKNELTSLQDIKQYLKKIEKQTAENKDAVSRLKDKKQYLKKIDTLEKQSAECKEKIKTLQTVKCKVAISVKSIAKINKKQIKKSKKPEPKAMDKYKKAIMYNIHNQIVQELQYAPYLPVSQLQDMMDKRFHLESMHFKICICENSSKTFKGIKISANKTESIIRDSALLEVRFDTK